MPGAEAERMGFDLERETFSTLLLIQLLKEQQIYAGVEAKAAVAANILRSLQSQGVNTLADFEKAMLQKEGLTLLDLDRFIGHQIGIQQLTAVEGLSGELITPQQIESLWRRENQELDAQAVFFSASNYLKSVTVTPEALGTFFTNQMARYRIPDRIQVAYVAFPISNYFAKADEQLAAVTNLDEQIDMMYQQRGTNYYSDLTPDEARQQIKEEQRRQLALLAAKREAITFADELWQQEPMKPTDMEEIGAQKGLTVQVTEPFDSTSTPAGLDVNSTFTQSAFRLRPDEPYAGPIEGDDYVYIITLKERLPSVNAAFEDVKNQVTEDYRLQQATLKARELGRAFAEQLTNSLATGKTFTEACTAAGYTPEQIPPFSQSTRSLPAVEEHTSAGMFIQTAFATPVGTASGFSFTSDGGYVVFVKSKLPVNETAMQEEMPRYAQFVRQTLRSEAFNNWFSQEATTGLRDTPINRPPPSEVSTPGS
jgi:hypothetical protein